MSVSAQVDVASIDTLVRCFYSFLEQLLTYGPTLEATMQQSMVTSDTASVTEKSEKYE